MLFILELDGLLPNQCTISKLKKTSRLHRPDQLHKCSVRILDQYEV